MTASMPWTPRISRSGPRFWATDSRARRHAERFPDDVLPLTGQMPNAGSPAAICAWLRDREPRTLERVRWLLFAKDWLRLCLTGEPGTDPHRGERAPSPTCGRRTTAVLR